MSRSIRNLLAVATLVVVIAAPSVAQASHIRPAVDRKSHPGHSFFLPAGQVHAAAPAMASNRPAGVLQWLRIGN